MTILEVKVFLQIEKQGHSYTVSSTYKKEKCSNPVKFEKTLYLDTVGSSDNLKVKGYRCYGHNLNSYFRDNIKSIKEGNLQNRSNSGINLVSGVDDLKDVKVELKVTICNVKIKIYDKHNSILTNLLYTSDEYLQNRNLYVYFYNPTSEETDALPLLFQYKDTFYAPESSETYFKEWKEVTELEGVINKQVNIELTNESRESIRDKEQKSEKIKNKLDKIFEMLHQVNLNKRTDYGIPFCSKELFYTTDFNTKRFDVKVSKNQKYQKVTHTSVNKYVIGSIKSVENCKFDEVNQMIKKDGINEVVAYFNKDNSPELILLNEKGSFGGSNTYGYYQKKGDVYVYEPIKYGINIEFNRSIRYDDEESPLIAILEKMEDEKMTDDHTQRQSDTYNAVCQQVYDKDSEDEQCQSRVGDTYSDRSSSNIRQIGPVQTSTAHNQHTDQVTVNNGITHRQDPESTLLPTKVSHTLTERSLSHEENVVTHESGQMAGTSVVNRGGSRARIVETAVEDHQPTSQVKRTYQSTGSIGQDLLRKEEEESVHTSEHQISKGDQARPGNNDEQSEGRNGGADEGPGTLPETPCTGEGDATTTCVNTGMKGFDDFMNGAIDYAKNNPGVVSGAGVGSLLGCAGGGYGVYKLVLRFI